MQKGVVVVLDIVQVVSLLLIASVGNEGVLIWSVV